MVLFIFLSNFPSLIISIFHFKHFSLSFLYWIWHFHSSSFNYWMWHVECFENNYLYMAIQYMMYNNNTELHISQCLSKAYLLFHVNITCALQSLFQCSNMLMAMSFFLFTWLITSWKNLKRKVVYFVKPQQIFQKGMYELDWWPACSRQNGQKWNSNNLLPFPILQAMSFIAFSLYFWTLVVSIQSI